MKTPTVRQLQYFVALTESGHFGRAAERCFVSQSAFSNAIKELETSLDAQLVDRTNRNVTITSTGQQVAVQARLVLRDLDALVETARGQQEPLTGELRLGVIPTIAPFMLPGALPKLREQYPDLRLLLVEDQTQRIHARLMQGELDVLLIALPWEMQGVDELPLFQDAFCLACHEETQHVEPENYRFSRLDSASILLLEDGHCLREHALAACKIRNTQKVSRFGASSLLTLIEMVDADLGVTFLPEMARGSSLLSNTQVQLHSMGEKSYRTIGLVWRKGSRRAEEFNLLGDFLRDNHEAAIR
ncbi:MAG: hydrogen peroxide-inducible genes activator [Woeseiaceae bacterium]|nr:hydrogen peroxide-inducible genes activator [Woeseiaceae bacterium]